MAECADCVVKMKKKERRDRGMKMKVSVVAARPMTLDEERRFQVAIDALLSEIVRQELGHQKGEENDQSRDLGRQPLRLPCSSE